MSNHARILFFATLREKTGVNETTIEFAQGTHIFEIKNLILEMYPTLKLYIDTMIVAMNHEFAFDEDIVPDEAEIAIFPPVSGGNGDRAGNTIISTIVDHEIDINAIIAKITYTTTGAVCVFTGTVREETSRGKAHHTKYLEYDAYIQMAETKMYQIGEEIRSRWHDIEGIAIVQRIGKLMPGMITVVIACSASHRDMGIFEAAHYGIDRLKEIVPIWKKEVSQDGEEWVEGEYIPERGE